MLRHIAKPSQRERERSLLPSKKDPFSRPESAGGEVCESQSLDGSPAVAASSTAPSTPILNVFWLVCLKTGSFMCYHVLRGRVL